MTLSVSPERTLREPPDRPVEPPSRTIAGILLAAPDVAIPLAVAP